MDRQFARHPDEPNAVLGRFFYLDYVGNDEALLKLMRDTRARIKSRMVPHLHYYVLYRRKRFAEALDSVRADSILDRSTRSKVEAILCATLGRRAEAEALFVQAIRGERGIQLSLVPAYMGILGPGGRTAARQAARDVLGHSSRPIPNWRDGWYRALFRFNAGELDADQLLAKAGDSQANLCEAYFHIGMRRLGEGKRTEAKRCFGKARDTGVYTFGEYMWSRAFLACIDDPEWLPWLAEKR
jgi:hypothetical protein